MVPLRTNSKFFSLSLTVLGHLLSNHFSSLSWNASYIKIRLFARRGHVQLSSVIRHFSEAIRGHKIWGIIFLARDVHFQGQQSSEDTHTNSSTSLRMPSALQWACYLWSSNSEIPKERIPSGQPVTIPYGVFPVTSALHQALQNCFTFLRIVIFDWGWITIWFIRLGLRDWFHSKEMAWAPGDLRNHLLIVCFLNTSCLFPGKIQGSLYRGIFSTL